MMIKKLEFLDLKSFICSEDYYRMKLQWKTINDEQKLKFTLMKERENLIGKRF